MLKANSALLGIGKDKGTCAGAGAPLILGRCASSSRLIASPSFAFTYATLPSVFLPVLPSPALQLPYSPSAAFTFKSESPEVSTSTSVYTSALHSAPSSLVPGSVSASPPVRPPRFRLLHPSRPIIRRNALLLDRNAGFVPLHELRGTENELDTFVSMIWEPMSSSLIAVCPDPRRLAFRPPATATEGHAPQLVACGPLAARAVITNHTHTGSAPSPFGPLADVPPTSLEGFVLAVHAD
ncbi:hypothetical protein B0H11DRAFT_2256152 [Mycena galericulata]|nr:hypothetical protein B0H11DRAFT_2256152 [Mycena galericulata]